MAGQRHCVDEVGLDGCLWPTRGVLPAIQTAQGARPGPAAALGRSAVVDRRNLLGTHTLAEVTD